VSTETKTRERADVQAAPVRTDAHIVRDCLDGNEAAWSELVEKYKNLIFSIPIKYGLTREEAADIFQEVCLELLLQLKNVREPQAVAKWLLMVTAHKCFHWKRRGQRMVAMDMPVLELSAEAIPPEALKLVSEAQEEQKLREAVGSLSDRCQSLVKMLFYEEPPRPYRDVARILGIATGSIGFIRQRCLESLRKRVEGA
jgi:RNA polymerase sigma factor (sigma-70 family)